MSFVSDSKGKPIEGPVSLEKVSTSDGLGSLIGNLGDPNRDKSAGTYFTNLEITDEQIQAAYECSWMAEVAISVPVEDCLRKGRIWNSEFVKEIEKEEARPEVNLWAKLKEAMIMARLWGGAAIYIATDQDPAEPLDLSRIKKGGLQCLTVLTRHELTAVEINKDIRSPYYNKVEYYRVVNHGVGGEEVLIHSSHLALFMGKRKADPWLSTNSNYMGWGIPLLKSISEDIRRSTGANNNVASLLFEASIDVIGIPHLMASVGDAHLEDNLLKRFRLAAANKGINGALMLDAEETYERKSASFAQLPEIMQSLANFVAAAARMPITKFLGQSPGGLDASGESDQDVYDDLLRSMQENDVRPAIANLDQCIVRSAIGNWPDDISYFWEPLRQMDPKEVAEISKLTAEALAIVSSLALYTPEEMFQITTKSLSECGGFQSIDAIVGEHRNKELDIEALPEEVDDPLEPEVTKKPVIE